MRSFLALVCASFLVCRANAQDAARCIITFTRVSPTTCDSINALALCVSNLESGDEFKVDVRNVKEHSRRLTCIMGIVGTYIATWHR